MKNILVPVGSKEKGINNLNYAIALALKTEATIYLINLYQEFSKVGGLSKLNKVIIEDSEALLEEVLASVDTQGVTIISQALKGDPFEGILRVSQQLDINLIILSPQSIDIKDEVFLGNVTGKIVKQSKTPILILPLQQKFAPISSILLAFKNGNLEDEEVLNPLKQFVNLFNSKVHLLQVKTPDSDENIPVNDALLALQNTFTATENATIFQGILEHFQTHQPDMLCVFRRKRGFFEKLWEKNSILKKDFHTTKPLLVLKGTD